MFTRWGGFVYRRRRWILLLSIVMAAGFGSLAGGVSENLSNGGWLDPSSESAQVGERLRDEFGGGRSAFIAVYRSAGPIPTPPQRRSRPRSRPPWRRSSTSRA